MPFSLITLHSSLILVLAMLAPASLSLAADPSIPAAPRVAWRTSIGKSSDIPAAADAKLILTSSQDSTLTASSPADGKPLWTIQTKSRPSSTPLLTDTTIYLGHADGLLSALDRTTGQTRWTFQTAQQIVGRPALAGDRLLVGSYDTNLYCLAADTGKELWHFKTAAQVHASPLIAGDNIIIGGCDGHLRAIELATGQERWSIDAGGPIATTPALQDGRLYFATMSSSISCIDTAGKTLWQVSPLKDQSPFTASPAISPDRIAFAADDGQLVILDPADGHVLAQGKLPGKPTTPLIFHNTQLLVGIDDGRIYIIDPATAKQISRITLGGTPLSLIPIADGLITNTSAATLWLLK